jgi:hypothetical protein
MAFNAADYDASEYASDAEALADLFKVIIESQTTAVAMLRPLQWAARDLAMAMLFDQPWQSVQGTLDQLVGHSSVSAILDRQRAAMAEISNSGRHERRVREQLEAAPSADDLAEAQADVLRRTGEAVNELEVAAHRIANDPRWRAAAESLAAVIRSSGAQKAGALGLLTILWWMLVPLGASRDSIIAMLSFSLLVLDRVFRQPPAE